MESKSSASTTPRSAFKVSITQKVNSRLKNDLKELEKVTMPKLPNKVNLNMNFQTINNTTRRNSTVSDLTGSPRKYPTLKNEYVSIDELRSRVHHGTLGVVPVRKSQEIDDLNFIMKGKPVVYDNLYPDEDEGINEPNSSENDDDFYDPHSNQNTPNSFYEIQNPPPIPMNRQNYLQYFYSQPKPAILPATGTSSTAKFTERPKPQKKPKILLRPIKKSSQPDSVSLESTKNEAELQQLELDNQVKELVEEARRLANVKKSKKTKKPDNQDPGGLEKEITVEKKVVKGVEGLITAIKSGQLISEQEQSNRKIQEILGTVLDKASLSLFDPSFSEHADEDKEADQNERQSMADSAIYNPENSIRESLGTQSVRDMTENMSLHDEKLSSENIHNDNQTVKSFVLSYQDEVDNYLASLPLEVTFEDVLNTTATSVKIFEKPKKPSIEKKPIEPSTDQKYARNLHLFCMLEHERRDSLLLPDELQDVTRKFHIRSKFGVERSQSSRPSDSFVTQTSTKFNDEFIAFNRTDRAAQRVVENLNEVLNFESNKSSLSNDSGFIDNELESWRKQAENSLEIDGKKMNLISFDDYKEFSLTFLKPAPPKMSVKPSKIRERLFPKYKSMPPPVDDLNLLKKKNAKFKFYSNKDLDDSDSDASQAESEEELEDSGLEMQLILDKMLNRQYNSDSDLSKLKTDENLTDPIFSGNKHLQRSLSETIVFRSKKEKTDDDDEDPFKYEFLKINSNYNDAIEEAMNQKKIIKQDFLTHKRVSHGSAYSLKSKSNTITSGTIKKTSETDDEIKRIENMTIPNGSNLQTNTSDNSKTQAKEQKKVGFFSKQETKSLAEEALENGRKYVLNETTKKVKKSNTKRRMSKNLVRYRNSALGIDLLVQLENEIYDKNKRKLVRSESTDRIKFKPKFNHPADDIFIEASRVKLIKRPSVSDFKDFDDFKAKKGFNESKWSKEKDTFYDQNREWTRDIWNEWFDEVIPKLDESQAVNDSKNEPKKDQEEKPKIVFDAKIEEKVEIENDEEAGDEYDEDDEKKTRKIVKSPTPYAAYSQINFDDLDETKINFQQIKIAEKEIEILNKRLEEKLIVFDLVRRGTLYRKLGFIKKALDDFNLAINLESKFVDAYWQRHLVYLVQDRKKDALEDLNLIVKLNRTHSGAYISRGDLFAERNDTAMAIVNYSQAVKYNPQDHQAFFKRGRMYEQRGDLRMAMDDYLTTTKLNPKNYEAWFKHGMSYFNSKNWHYAIVDFSELIKHNPLNQAQARLYRGKCYLNLNEYQPAFDDFCVALHLNPNDWESYYHRGCLLRKLDPFKSLQDFSISLLIEDGYDNLKSYLHRGILYSELEKFYPCMVHGYDEAIKDFESVLALDKEYSPAYVNLGIIYMNLTMNYWKAIKYFNLAIKSNPVYIRAYLCRAQAYRYVHDLKRAYLDYTKAIHMDPMNTQIYIYRGQTILEMGDLKLAAFCVQHASFMNDNAKPRSLPDDEIGSVIARAGSSKFRSTIDGTNNAMSSMTNVTNVQNQSVTQRALVFSFLKNHEKAISVLEQELKIKATTSIYNLLGRVFMKAKRWTDAVNAFEKSIDLNFDDTKSHNKSMSTTNHSYSKIASLTGLKANKKDLIDAHFMKGQCLVETSKYSEAYNSFDKVIELKPDNAQAYYYRGITRVHLKHQRCIQDFNKALALDPTLFEAFLARACIYGMQERYTKAILNCNQAVKLNSKSVRGYLYRGALKYLSRSFTYAIHDLTEAINLDQTCVLAYFNRALCFQQIKNHKNALKDFSIVLMLGDYLKFRVLINRGLLYFHLKDFYNSLNDFKMAAEYSPSDYDIQHMIGLCLHKLERYGEAIDRLSKAYHINPRLYDALISRANVYVDLGYEEAFDKAQKDYETVLGLASENLDAHINLAYLYQITGRFKKAWDQFTSVLKFSPRCIPAYEGRAVVCLQMSDTLAAMKDINQAIKIKPSAELLVNRGVIYQFMADNINAMRDYQAAILMDTTFGLAFYNSANILLLHKQFDQAIKNLDIAIEKCDMKDESTYQNRAIAKALKGDTSGAFRDLCEAIKYGKYTSHLFMNRGILLYRMENYNLAHKDFTTAINLSPNDGVLYKLRADCRGKMAMREDAMNDYKMAVDLQQREKFRKMYQV